MNTMASELRQAARALGRAPGASVLAVLMLGFGIGAAATTFSSVYAALFRPVPFAEPERLVWLYTMRTSTPAGTVRLRWSPADTDVVRRSARSFAAIATYTRTTIGIGGGGDAEQIDAEVVSAGYFEALHAQPAIGRGFAPHEEAPGNALVVLGDGLWRRRFAADSHVAGRTLPINGVPMTVVGVMPAGFAGVTGHAALWFPRGMAPQLTYREYLVTPQHFMNLIARLAPGVTLAQANAELAALAPRLPGSLDPGPPTEIWSAGAMRLGDARIDSAERRSLVLLLAGGGCVLAVTCLNVALLLLARARARRGEMAVRLALGASRPRLIRQLLVESGLIAALGGALGVLLSGWGVAWLRLASPAALPSPQNNYGQIGGFSTPALDGVILAFIVVIVFATTLAAGVAPAFAATAADPAEALAGSSRALAGGGRGRTLPALVVSQVAVAVLLLAGALLLAQSVGHLQAARSGFDPTALSFWINAPASRYADADGPQVVERILARIQRVPGVVEAAVNRCTPYGASCARTLLFIAARPTPPENAPVVGRHYVSADYFHALGIALRRGRLLSDEDRQGRPPVTVINETAARRFWPGEDPIGKRVWFGAVFTDAVHSAEIVGVVADVKYWPANEPVGPDFYTSYLQFTYPSSLYVVKAANPSTVMPAIRRAVAEVDDTLPIYDVRETGERVAEAVAGPRFVAVVTGTFAVSAAVLAALGVFGVMAYSVSVRRDELALRLALGATPRLLRRAVLLQATRLAACGAAAGLVLAVWLLGSIQSALYGIAPSDPLTLAGAVATMGLVAIAAAAAPAWRASTTDPMIALRRS